MIKSEDLFTRLVGAIGKLHQESSDFDLYPVVDLPKSRLLRPAAVLVAIQNTDAGPHIILTERASTLKHHAGQIAFPGGKYDECDTNIGETALREADEEIGLHPECVKIIGRMPPHETITGFTVTPVIGMVTDKFTPEPDHNEVAEVFLVPLSHVINTKQYSIQDRYWRNQRRRYYAVPYGPYYIWGATARILRALADGMQE